MEEDDDAYEILGVSADASTADIKKAYRKLALQNHPDKQTNETDRERAHSTFAKIANAYQILSDDEVRRKYDMRRRMKNGTTTTTTPGEWTNTSYKPASTVRTTTSACPNGQKGSKVKPQQYQSQSPSSTCQGGGPTRTTTRTSTKTYTTPDGQRHTHTQTVHAGGTGGENGPGNFTFSFTSNSFNPEFDDPLEVFKKMFREEYGKEFDPTEAFTSSPIKSTKSSPTKLQTTKIITTPVASTTQKATKGLGQPVRKSVQAKNKTEPVDDKNDDSSNHNKPSSTFIRRVISPTNGKTQRSHTPETAVRCPPGQCSDATYTKGKTGSNTFYVVSKSSKTRTIMQSDGTQQIITETTTTMSDGSFSTQTETKTISSRSTTGQTKRLAAPAKNRQTTTGTSIQS